MRSWGTLVAVIGHHYFYEDKSVAVALRRIDTVVMRDVVGQMIDNTCSRFGADIIQLVVVPSQISAQPQVTTLHDLFAQLFVAKDIRQHRYVRPQWTHGIATNDNGACVVHDKVPITRAA